jgi:hypothetical protein
MSTHVARIAKVDSVSPIQGADRIQTAYVLGAQVIVSKDVLVGSIGVLFDGELALSKEYCSHNNLFREKQRNLDQEKAGFFDNNGKIRVQKFLKVRSEGLFMPISSLDFTGYDTSKLGIGDSFNELNAIKICEKYISERTRRFLSNSQNQKKAKNVETPLFREHLDTEQLAYYIDTIPVGALISLHHKQHGSSGRASYTKVVRQEKVREEKNTFIRSINKNISSIRYIDSTSESYEYLAGSRRVVLFPEKGEKIGFHGSEQYRFDILDMFKPYLSKGQTIYFEIVGYVNGGPIMGKHEMSKLKDESYTKKYGKEITYKYGCLPDQYKVFVYRISMTGDDGETIDYTSQQVISWCEKRGFAASKPLVAPFIYDGDKEKLMNLVKGLAERPDKLCEDYVDPSHINEGCILRADFGGQTPLFYKYKSFPFKVLEGIAKENDQLDTEEAS